MSNLSPSVAMLFFWCGLFLLVWLVGAARSAAQLAQRLTQAETDLRQAFIARQAQKMELFNAMSEVCPPYQRDAIIRTAAAASEAATESNKSDYFAAEQALSGLLETLLRNHGTNLDPQGAWAEHESHLAALRESYNSRARTVAGARQSFPAGLFIRSLVTTDPPLFQ